MSELPPILTPPLLPALPPVLAQPPLPEEPVRAAERIETLDALRGGALFGILTVNMALFSWPFYKVMVAAPQWAGVDRWSDLAVRLLAEGKFYPLFSFLFGVGAAIQMDRAEARGASFGSRYTRRLLVLLGIGLIHAFLLWEGDILVLYAVTGFLVLPFRNCRPRTVLLWAGILLLAPAVLCGGFSLLLGLGSLIPEVSHVLDHQFQGSNLHMAALTERNLEVFANGSFGEICGMRARNVLTIYSSSWFAAPTVLGMFLLGLTAWRRGIFREVEGQSGLIRRVTLVGWAVGLPLNLVCAAITLGRDGDGFEVAQFISAAILAIGGPALSLAYAGTLTLLLRRESWQRVLRPVAAAGRMGLSNYLLQSLICTTIFYSYGLGWYGSVGRTGGLGLALVIYASQLGWSVWWLRHFRFGPAEWLWRSATYGERQPMRV
jgi:uncharacterized protein